MIVASAAWMVTRSEAARIGRSGGRCISRDLASSSIALNWECKADSAGSEPARCQPDGEGSYISTRGWENATLHDVRDRRVPVKPSKYRNVKITVNGEVFDSKREAAYWQGLKAREHNGEITKLRRQVSFPLLTCQGEWPNVFGVQVSTYVADFSYYDRDGERHVVDAKGKRTQMYALKKKWLELQDGIVIEEV
jgi:hypothetical protein